MKKWIGLLFHLGGGRKPHFVEDFFSWWDRQIVSVDNYAYTGVEFQ